MYSHNLFAPLLMPPSHHHDTCTINHIIPLVIHYCIYRLLAPHHVTMKSLSRGLFPIDHSESTRLIPHVVTSSVCTFIIPITNQPHYTPNIMSYGSECCLLLFVFEAHVSITNFVHINVMFAIVHIYLRYSSIPSFVIPLYYHHLIPDGMPITSYHVMLTFLHLCSLPMLNLNI
jgi:hypothetical protein